MQASLRARMGMIFSLGFLILIVASVTATLVVTGFLDRDQAALNLLRQQQAKVEEIPDLVAAGEVGAWKAIRREIDQSAGPALAGNRTTNDYGPGIVLSPTERDDLTDQMRRLKVAWDELRREVDRAFQAPLGRPSDPRTLAAVEQRTAALVAEMDRAVHLYETATRENMAWLRGIQVALFFSALVFLLEGYWLTNRTVVGPVEALQAAAQRIAAGDLDTTVKVEGQAEFRALAESFETMRVELKSSHDSLRRAAEELAVQVAQRTQALSALYQVVTVASRPLDPIKLLDTALDKALEVMNVEMGGIWLLTSYVNQAFDDVHSHREAEADLHLVAHRGLSAPLLSAIERLQLGEGLTGQVALTGKPLTVSDISQDPRLARVTAAREGLRSFAAVPLKAKERVLGVMDVVTRDERPFTAEEMALLVSIGRQIGIALENIILLRQTQRQAQRVATLEERERIAADMHDGLAQTLSYLHLKADRTEALAAEQSNPTLVQELAEMRQVLEQVCLEVRHFIGQLCQPMPPPAVLQEIIADVVARFRNSDQPPVVVDMDGTPPMTLPAQVHTQVSRILSEALTNAQRHARASRIDVRLRVKASQVTLVVEDDGQGFDQIRPASDGRHHFGLSLMQARAARIGGHLTVQSAPGQGTRVLVTWPVTSEEEPQ